MKNQRKSKFKTEEKLPRLLINDKLSENFKPVNIKRITHGIFNLTSYEEYINLKCIIQEFYGENYINNNLSSDNNESSQPGISHQTVNSEVYNKTSADEDMFNEDYTYDGILVLEINEKKLKIEIEYDRNFKVAKVKAERDLQLLSWWLNKNYAIICKENIKLKMIFNKEDKDNLKYRGYIKDNKRCGFGMIFRKNGSIEYIGNFQEDFWHGRGVLLNNDGKPIYRGEFKENVPNGFGLKQCKLSGRMYCGNFANKTENGYGRLYEDDGSIIQEGEWRAGRPHGFGIKYDDIGMKTYEGMFKSGIPVYITYNKPIKIYHKNQTSKDKSEKSGNLKYIGNEKNGSYHGVGRSFTKNGELQYDGGYTRGKFTGIGTQYSYNLCQEIGKMCKNVFLKCFGCCFGARNNKVHIEWNFPTQTDDQGSVKPATMESPSTKRMSRKSFVSQKSVTSNAGFDVSNFDNNYNYNIIDTLNNLENEPNDINLKDEFDNCESDWYTIPMIESALVKLNSYDLDDLKQKSQQKSNIYREYFGFFKLGKRVMQQEKIDYSRINFSYYKEEYYLSGELKYRGYYMYGLKHGRGKFFYNNKKNSLCFNGEWKKGYICGQGTLFSINGLLLYHGNFDKETIVDKHPGNLIININKNLISVISEAELEEEELDRSVDSMRKSEIDSYVMNAFRTKPNVINEFKSKKMNTSNSKNKIEENDDSDKSINGSQSKQIFENDNNKQIIRNSISGGTVGFYDHKNVGASHKGGIGKIHHAILLNPLSYELRGKPIERRSMNARIFANNSKEDDRNEPNGTVQLTARNSKHKNSLMLGSPMGRRAHNSIFTNMDKKILEDDEFNLRDYGKFFEDNDPFSLRNKIKAIEKAQSTVFIPNLNTHERFSISSRKEFPNNESTGLEINKQPKKKLTRNKLNLHIQSLSISPIKNKTTKSNTNIMEFYDKSKIDDENVKNLDKNYNLLESKGKQTNKKKLSIDVNYDEGSSEIPNHIERSNEKASISNLKSPNVEASISNLRSPKNEELYDEEQNDSNQHEYIMSPGRIDRRYTDTNIPFMSKFEPIKENLINAFNCQQSNDNIESEHRNLSKGTEEYLLNSNQKNSIVSPPSPQSGDNNFNIYENREKTDQSLDIKKTLIIHKKNASIDKKIPVRMSTKIQKVNDNDS